MHPNAKNKRGIAAGIVLPLLMVLFLSVGFLTYLIITSSRSTSRYLHKERAVDLAQAGTQDALFWFRRQTLLPVGEFEPTSAESEDPSRGIMRSVTVDERNLVKGIYIVEKDLTEDLTEKRGEIGSGWIWKISSRGVVYIENDSTYDFDEPPNDILEDVRVTTEIRMLNINPAVEAAVVLDKGRDLTCESRCMLIGGNAGTGIAGICYKRYGNPIIRSGADVRGDPRYKSFSELKLTCRDIFGMEETSLRNLADYISDEGAEGLPLQLPDFALIYIQGDCEFTASHPLNGGGVLFVDGDLTFATGSNSNFVGMIYVTGRIDLRPPSWVEGQIVTVGGGEIGTGGYDKSTVLYNSDVLNLVVQLIGNYRMKRTYSLETL